MIVRKQRNYGEKYFKNRGIYMGIIKYNLTKEDGDEFVKIQEVNYART